MPKKHARKKQQVCWKARAEKHDYPAAVAYLSLVADDDLIARTVAQLRVAPVRYGKAKDILRASRLPLLSRRNPQVAEDIARIKAHEPLAPILLVRGWLLHDIALQVADGYHRVCATYHVNEDTLIPYQMAVFGHPHLQAFDQTVAIEPAKPKHAAARG